MRKVLRWWGDSLNWEHAKSEQKIVFPDHVGPNGEPSTLLLAHCQDPDTLRGPDVAFFFGDEAALYREETWMVLLGRTRQPGYPHRGWLCSTPKGQNWLYRTFVAGRDEWTEGKQAQYGLHHWQTKDNPLYETDPDFIDALKVAYGEGSDFWRQEVEAEFVSFAGLVYGAWDAETMIVTKDQLPKTFDRMACGVDWGVTSPGAFEVLGLADGVTYLIEEVYERGKIIAGAKGNDWLSEAKDIHARFPELKFYADPEDANAIETFRRAGLPIEKANNKRIPGVRACQAVITGNTFRVLEDAAPNWLAEIGQYHWQEDRDGNPKEDADPAKEFDHAMDAWRYGQIELSGGEVSPGLDFL
jgi:PBSX family phage terminase large subunit